MNRPVLNRIIFVGLAGAALALAGCGPRYEAPRPAYGGYRPVVEPVYGWRDAGEEVLVRVSSNGCTNKDSFVAEPRVVGSIVRLRLVRVHRDDCRALLPQGVELSWSKYELGLLQAAPVQVVNPQRGF